MKYVLTLLLALTLAGCAVTKHAGGPPPPTSGFVGTWQITVLTSNGVTSVFNTTLANYDNMPQGCWYSWQGQLITNPAPPTNHCFQGPGTEISGVFYYTNPLLWVNFIDYPSSVSTSTQIQGNFNEQDGLGGGGALLDFQGTRVGATITGNWFCEESPNFPYVPVCQGDSGTFTATKQ